MHFHASSMLEEMMLLKGGIAIKRCASLKGGAGSKSEWSVICEHAQHTVTPTAYWVRAVNV